MRAVDESLPVPLALGSSFTLACISKRKSHFPFFSQKRVVTAQMMTIVVCAVNDRPQISGASDVTWSSWRQATQSSKNSSQKELQ